MRKRFAATVSIDTVDSTRRRIRGKSARRHGVFVHEVPFLDLERILDHDLLDDKTERAIRKPDVLARTTAFPA